MEWMQLIGNILNVLVLCSIVGSFFTTKFIIDNYKVVHKLDLELITSEFERRISRLENRDV